MTEALTALKKRLADILALQQAGAVLGWDQQTYMPPGATEARARQLAVLGRLSHDMFVADEIGALIDKAGAELNGAGYESDDASLVRVAKRDYEQQRKLPSEFVEEMTRLTTLAYDVWARARANNDFKGFAPLLEQIMDLKRQEAAYRGGGAHPYDALIDTYEPGTKTADVAAMFADLRRELVPLVAAIRERLDRVDDAPLHQDFDPAKQRAFAEMVIQRFGFDFNRGRQDPTVHPFCTSFSRDDVRITTRFDPKWLNPALFGTLHETGHGLYEQGSGEALEGTVLSGGTSLGVHESQSRLWENIVGRSRGFWSCFYPQLQETFPAQLGNVSLDAFYRAINKVSPSFIRVEADEVTYNLHIMIRFEIETDLLAGKVKVADLPELWNTKYQEYLGITPPTDTLGVLQDVHWSSGLVGYFPTYSMGNLLSAQLYEKAVAAHPSIPDDMARGEFGLLLNWMRENIHQYGRKFEPKELIERATGEPMQARSYMKYLKAKYGEIYGV
ncbi:MAG: carboxypeptidase M32 [Anaerolineae bacterium]|nr:carboxypeptidase M32 [Anaerolineae bacterium]